MKIPVCKHVPSCDTKHVNVERANPEVDVCRMRMKLWVVCHMTYIIERRVKKETLGNCPHRVRSDWCKFFFYCRKEIRIGDKETTERVNANEPESLIDACRYTCQKVLAYTQVM